MHIVPVDKPTQERRKADADQLREIADQVESGQVTRYVLVGIDREDNTLFSISEFDCRWTMLGALEYAKHSIQAHN